MVGHVRAKKHKHKEVVRGYTFEYGDNVTAKDVQLWALKLGEFNERLRNEGEIRITIPPWKPGVGR